MEEVKLFFEKHAWLIGTIPLVFIGIALLINNKTSQDILKQTKEKLGLRQYQRRKCVPLLILFLVYILLAILFLFEENKLESVLLLSIISIQGIMTYIAFLTDPIVSRINRFSLRFGYMSNFVFLQFYAIVKNGELDKSNLITQLICLAILLFGFFFIHSIGSSDFRCFFLAIPTQILFFENWASLSIMSIFLYITIYQIYKKMTTYDCKSIRDFKVPIGDKILLPNFVLVLLYTVLRLKGMV